MATVYLHIGTMKTGTSALQRFLDENREHLKKQGVIYPKLDLGLPMNYQFRNGHFIVYSAGGTNKVMEAHVDGQAVMEKAYEQIGELAKEYDNILLSEELLWHHSAREPEFWEKVSDNFRKINCELRIILYLRRQDALIESLYSHAIKSNHMLAKSFSEYKDGRAVNYFALDYYKNIKAMEQQIGKENLIVRVYEKERFVREKDAIFWDFLDAIGLPEDEGYQMQEEAKNPGLEGNFIEFKRIMNGLPEYKEMGNFMARPLSLASAVKTQGKIRKREGFFTAGEREKFMARFEEGNRKLAEEYLGRKDGKLFRETVEEPPAWELDRETMWRDIIISMTEAFCAQEKKMTELQEELKALEEIGDDNWCLKAYRKVRRHLKNR